MFSLLGCNEDVSKKEMKPNIIFIMADDLGYHDLGSYGQKKILTPHLDQMADEGIRFTNVYSGSTVCAPARSVLMTGQHTGNTTVRGNFTQASGLPGRRVPLQESDTTLADVIKQAGYATGITGKWGLGEPGTTGIPNKQGFDEWFGYLNQRHAHTYYPEYLWRNEERVILEGNLDGKREVYTHDLFANFALDFIRENRDTNFFLYLAYTVPHSDYEIPDTDPYTDSLWTDNEKIHAAMITRMDRDIGRMMQLLTDLGIDDNTIVFFCSDNGAAEFWEGRFDSSFPLRGRKRDMYEGGIRVPMVVRYPVKVPAGKVSDQPWYFPDVLPTIADLAGVTPPASIDGISVLPLLFGENQETDDRIFYWEFWERGFQQAARWRNWKAVKLGPDMNVELYDLSIDISEENNLAAEFPEIVKIFEDAFVNERVPSSFWPDIPVE